jgi:YHS domain-containing protein
MKYGVLFILLMVFISCKNNMGNKEASNPVDSAGIDQLNIINEKDPICDMDTQKHLSDTALINGEIWGFCSIVCKEKYVQRKVSKE